MTDPAYTMLDFIGKTGGISQMQNPITRSMVKIEPPLICTDPERFKLFEKRFWRWCEALWEINRIDPDVLISDRDWLLSDNCAMFTRDLTGAQG